PAAGPAPVASNNPFANRQGGRAVATQAQAAAPVPIPFTAQPVSQVHAPGTPAQNLIPDPAGARRFTPQAAPTQQYVAPMAPASAAPQSIPAPYPGGNARSAPANRNTLAAPAARASLPPAAVAL